LLILSYLNVKNFQNPVYKNLLTKNFREMSETQKDETKVGQDPKLEDANNRQVIALQGLFGKALSAYMPNTKVADDLIHDPSPIYNWVASLSKVPGENPMHRQVKREWQKIYKTWFGLKVNLSQVVIPAIYDPKKHWAIIVAKGTTTNAMVTDMRKKFKVYLYTEDLDASVKNDRVADQDYCVLVKKNVEADPDLKNLSANVLADKENFKGITLLERLLLEVYYFSKTKKHLDNSNWTLCSGSRYSDGRVPSVSFGSVGSHVNVNWDDPDHADGDLRSRAVFLVS
jgi:hypothetical protein